MKTNMLRCLLFLSIVFISNSSVYAQGVSTGLAGSVVVPREATDGDIICEMATGYVRCDKPYQPTLYGVITVNPAVAILASNGAKPVISSGNVYVKVSSINGVIKKGDYITSSLVTGIGQRATRSGYVLGTALENYEEENVQVIGRIQVAVGIRPAILSARADANLLELIRQGIDASYLSPLMALRYVLAAFMTIGSFLLGFWYFGKIAQNGVEAIGRNPLARTSIQMSILFNVGLTIAIMIVGLGLSYLLLIF